MRAVLVIAVLLGLASPSLAFAEPPRPGVGHDHLQITLHAQMSTKILKDIASVVAKLPTLNSGLQEIEDHVQL
jgi:hypothetical protein